MKFLITGGAGFIGSNAAHQFLSQGHQVTILDNLSRNPKLQIMNLDWLSAHKGYKFLNIDIRNYELLQFILDHNSFDVIIHLAGQTAVTTSVLNPLDDFENNALGTLNLLEAIRNSSQNPIFVYSSTNKVYGGLEHLEVQKLNKRNILPQFPQGVNEDCPLDFHSPYGCSKGVSDQYIRDYHRIYGLKTIVFRQSCIYGPRQFGIEDQGWLAWFIIATLTNKPITIFGDGRQTRDVLYVDDLINLYQLAIENIDISQGQVFNVGGGADFSLSLLEFIDLLNELQGKPLKYSTGPMRPGDQPVFIADTSKANQLLNWKPKIDPHTGIKKLYTWIKNHQALF